MDTNPYRAPKADVEIPDNEPDIPLETLKAIRNAWIAAVVSGVITLFFSLIGMAGGGGMGFDAWTLIDAALIFGLAFGIYRKSRACALIMLIYFIGSKILMMMDGFYSNPIGIVIALAFLYWYTKGVIGTFAYHKLIKNLRS